MDLWHYQSFIQKTVSLQILTCSLLQAWDVETEAEAVEAVLFLWKRKREKSTASAST